MHRFKERTHDAIVIRIPMKLTFNSGASLLKNREKRRTVGQSVGLSAWDIRSAFKNIFRKSDREGQQPYAVIVGNEEDSIKVIFLTKKKIKLSVSRVLS